jgi:hypothetical protein
LPNRGCGRSGYFKKTSSYSLSDRNIAVKPQMY